ncbi:MAG: putative 4-hydroxybenzoate polyprenyltransferase [Planctomycetota bacterium]|nr:putative 4-hydroxybenzoate polyprenyltransferase [Planctomycetota bacterium]
MTTPLAHPSPGLPARVALLARDIKLSHSVFALPFALLSAFLAAARRGDRHPDGATLGLIVLCMVLARTMAMAVNRWADAGLDAANPRTARRAIPSGQLAPSFVLTAALACAAGFILACAGFWLLSGNLWPLLLSPLVLGWLALYSFTKRFTWLCHIVLGIALALSPLAAAIAVNPPFLARPEPWLLFAMVACWVAGFDVLYALQDIEVDRRMGLHSMPSRLGAENALWISRGLHLASFAALFALSHFSPHLGLGFRLGVGGVAGLLILEHVLVWRSSTHHIHMAFFTINGVISLLLGGLGFIDILMR